MALRQACNRLCVLLGMPATDLESQLGTGPIPEVPETVAIGIPAELLRRCPDIRRAERLAAAQAEQIGIAEADLYPMFAIDGTLGWEAERLSQLFTSGALSGNIGPTFRWNILHYGRIRNNMRLQDARFWSLVMAYQETVLRANAEVEHGLAAFRQALERARLLEESVAGAKLAVESSPRTTRGGRGLQSGGADPAEPGPATGPARPGPRRRRPGIDSGLPGTRWRLGTRTAPSRSGPFLRGTGPGARARLRTDASGTDPG